MRAAVVGVGGTELVRSTDLSLLHFGVEAAKAALADAGLGWDDIDGYVGSPAAPNHAAVHRDGIDELSAALMTRALGISPSYAIDIAGMPAAGLATAAAVVDAGLCRAVLMVRAMYNPTGERYSFANSTHVGGPEQFTLPVGVGPAGARHAQWLARYQAQYGANRAHMYHVVETFREHASLNEYAYWRNQPLSFDEYMSARWICEPLCLYDCDLPITGAAALVVVSAELARELSRPAAYVRAASGATRPEHLFERAHVSPSEVDVAQIYDGYASFVYLWLERLKLAPQGTAFRMAAEGALRIGGKLPTNTFGGALGEGRLHGMGHVREAALQAMGRAGPRQVAGVRNSLVVVGIPESAWALILSPTIT